MKIINLFLVSILFAAALFAQQDSLEHEISGNIQELSDFHEVIYKIWHEAYPEKNYEALKSFTKEINEGAEKIYMAQLPGILRDKKAKWEAGLDELKASVEGYNSAAVNNNNEALLDAAETLHSKFEMMVRIIRPVLKEVDEFHKVLYVVYHKDLPAQKYNEIKQKSAEFVSRAEAITSAKLPKRLEKKADKFNKAAAELLEASRILKNLSSGDASEQEIGSAVNRMHSKYQVLEMVFE